MESKMDNNTQNLTSEAAWNAFYDRMYNNSSVTSRTKVTDSSKNYLNNESGNQQGFETYHLFSKLTPNIEVVVVDPLSFYLTENEDSESDSDSDSDIETQIDVQQLFFYQNSKNLILESSEVQRMGNDLAQCPPTPPSSEESIQIVDPAEPVKPDGFRNVNKIDLQLPQSSLTPPSSEESEKLVESGKLLEHVDIVDPSAVETGETVELIDGLFDSVPLYVEEHVISYENNNQTFDLAAYVTDQSDSSIDSPEFASPSEDIKTYALHPIVQQTIKADDSKIMADRSRRKMLKREYLGDGSDSEDDCKILKKRKPDDDPLWIPAEKSKTTVDNNRKVQRSNEDIHVVPKINGIRYGIGRGKDIATLVKYYKRSTFSENLNCDNTVNKTVNKTVSRNKKSPNQKTMVVNKLKEQIRKRLENKYKYFKRSTSNKSTKCDKVDDNKSTKCDKVDDNKSTKCDKVDNKIVNRNQKSPSAKTIENVYKAQEQMYKKRKENHSSVQKSKSVINKSKVTKMNAADLSDFEKAILVAKVRPNLPKGNNFTVQSRKIQFQEHSEKFRQYLSDKAAKSKILKENNHRVPVAHVVKDVPKADSRKILSKLPEQSRTIAMADNCAIIQKKEEPTTGPRKISIHEYLQRKSAHKSATSENHG